MKTIIVALAMMILPVATVPQAMDADGWNGAKWGMTLEQVKAAITFPLERNTYYLKAGIPRYMLTTAEPFKMLDIPVRAIFSFSPDEKLVSIVIRVENVFLESSHSQSDLFDRFGQLLTEQYGKPNFTDDDRRTVVWRLPSTSIRLQWTKFGGGTFMGVTYAQSDKKVTSTNRNLGTSLRSNLVEI